MKITSSAFRNGGPIPRKYAEDGENLPPPLSWSDVPAGTRELMLICDDTDAPTPEPYTHWVVYGITPGQNEIPEGGLRGNSDAHEGVNSANQPGYLGPAPPPGDPPHHYHFRLYALDEPTNLPEQATRSAAQQAMAGRVLAQSELEGTYSRESGR